MLAVNDELLQPEDIEVLAAGRAARRPAGGDLLQPIDLHGWSTTRVQDRQRRTVELICSRRLLDPDHTHWVDDIAFRNRLDDGREGPEMVVIPAGSFLMGAPEDEPESSGYERPQHSIRIGRPFAIGRYALTFDDFDAYCAATAVAKPSDRGWGRGTRPVINAFWDQVSAFVAWLVERTGRTYRLPNEAEWEYAARAGTTTAFWWGSAIETGQANYDGNYSYADGPKGEYREQTLPVDAFEPNPWGLFQAHGNVLEWCADDWHDDYSGASDDGSIWNQPPDEGGRRLLRGGSWYNIPLRLCSAYRGRDTRGSRFHFVGARLAQDLFV